MAKSILFISSNYTWGGSEILWSETAKSLAGKGFDIKFAVKYNNSIVHKLQKKGALYIDLNQPYPSLIKRLLIKANIKKPAKEVFLRALLDYQPQLVVISQGNNVDGRNLMTICKENRVPYVTITQLVTNFLWVFLTDETIDELRAGYSHAKFNYFVSRANLDLHNLMIGEIYLNSKIVLNPFTVPEEVASDYPESKNGQYEIGLVGRLETFHKGHDLLLDVLRQPKWKLRPVNFNFYGAGPHQALLERLVQQYGIKNVIFKGHVQDVASIWKNNHLLILPSRMEGQALALIEAMWCYRGAVVTDVGGACELITDEVTGFVAPLPTFKDLDIALEKAWLLRDKWDEIGRNAGLKVRQVYKNNPIESFGQEIINIVEELVLQ